MTRICVSPHSDCSQSFNMSESTRISRRTWDHEAGQGFPDHRQFGHRGAQNLGKQPPPLLQGAYLRPVLENDLHNVGQQLAARALHGGIQAVIMKVPTRYESIQDSGLRLLCNLQCWKASMRLAIHSSQKIGSGTENSCLHTANSPQVGY